MRARPRRTSSRSPWNSAASRPVLVAPDYPIEEAAERIAVGKLFNAGQTCIAPDYVLVPRGSEARFVCAFRDAAARLYPTLAANPDYTAIVNERHYDRLTQLVADARQRGARVDEINPGRERLDPVRPQDRSGRAVGCSGGCARPAGGDLRARAAGPRL